MNHRGVEYGGMGLGRCSSGPDGGYVPTDGSFVSLGFKLHVLKNRITELLPGLGYSLGYTGNTHKKSRYWLSLGK